MILFTLDSNCIIDLEERRPDAIALERLKEIWLTGSISIAVVSVSASENQPTGEAMADYAQFEAKLAGVGLESALELPPVMYWDFGYWDHCLWASDHTAQEIADIRDVLFPASLDHPPSDPSQNSSWRNQTCDVLVAWAHRHYGADHPVTRDQNFHRKRVALAGLGVSSIVSPTEALEIAGGA